MGVFPGAVTRAPFSQVAGDGDGGTTTWHAYARHVIEYARARGRAVRVAPDAILPVPTSAFPTPARRPANSRLDTRKLQHAFGLTLPAWQLGVDRMLEEIL